MSDDATLRASDQAIDDAEQLLKPERRRGGRRGTDRPVEAWSTTQMANCIGMSPDFVVGEIKAGELRASKFGREYRMAVTEVCRYLVTKGFPVPADLASVTVGAVQPAAPPAAADAVPRRRF